MEEDLFELYERQGSLVLEVGHNSVADWNVIIYDKKGKALGDYGKPVIHIQDCSRKTVFAKAYVELTEYLSEHRDGY